MFNPYHSPAKVRSAEQLIGREDQLAALRSYLLSGNNAVLFGPEGSGKSTLLDSFFNIRSQKALAADNRILTYCGSFPENMSGEEVYGYFADAILSAINKMDMGNLHEDMAMLSRQIADRDARGYNSQKAKFDYYLDMVEMGGYHMVFVLDNFENFTSSTNIKPEHHDLLCGYLNDSRMQMVVASNYDFNRTSLPAGTRNSQLLTRLSPNRVELAPLDIRQCAELLERTAGSERFTEEQVKAIWELSGGIPRVLFPVAKFAFELLCDGETPDDWQQQVMKAAGKELAPLMTRWCKITPREQLDIMHALATGGTCDSSPDSEALMSRGLLRHAWKWKSNGKLRQIDGFRFNCRLMEDFCRDSERLDMIYQANPLRPAEPELSALPAADSAAPGTVVNNYYVQGNYIEKQQNLMIGDGTLQSLFNMMDMDASALRQAMESQFGLGTRVNLDALPPEAREAAIEAAVEETEQKIAGSMDEASESEKKTLAERFQSIRASVDSNVTDELLASLSEKCRMYLQIAFVVEHALEPLRDYHLGDLSPQMVMYGKVLEQHLRDNFHPLFRSDEDIRYYDTHEKAENRNSKENFANKSAKKSHIGDYQHMMLQKARRLAIISQVRGVRFGGKAADEGWWEALAGNVDAARILRNSTDHAGSETTQLNLEKMHKLLFGEGKIVVSCLLGSELYEKRPAD